MAKAKGRAGKVPLGTGGAGQAKKKIKKAMSEREKQMRAINKELMGN